MPTFNAKLGTDAVTIVAPAAGTFDPAAFHLTFPTPGLYGLDVEGTWMGDLKQFDPEFEIRLIQFATVDTAWVLDLDDPEQYRAARELLGDENASFASHTNMDVLSVFTRLGVDITGRNVDTRLLSRMVNPDEKSGHDLKALTAEHIGPQLGEFDKQLDELFLRMWVDAGGSRAARKAKGDDEDQVADNDVARYGWSAIEVTNEVYLTYAGLDAIACRRLVPILVGLTGAPPELLHIETWLAGQANRIQIRGARIDPEGLELLQGEAERETADVREQIARLTVEHPLVGCASFDGWPAKKKAEGFSPLAPMLRPHPRNMRGEDGKAIPKPGGKGYVTEPCCDGWLAQHGVDWSTWAEKDGAFTDAGLPSLEKDNILLLDQYELDQVGRAVVDQMKRYRQFHDVLNKTKGIRSGLDPNGHVHPVLHTIGTVTGRMSSVAPNFQNFSKKNPKMRGLFVPEPGHIFVTADFDQVELRVVAALAREQKMIDTILAGGDLHQLTADEIGIERDLAKMVNFLIVYGGGGPALHEQGGIPLDRAYEIVDSFRKRYPAIARLAAELGKRRDFVVNVAGRRIPVTTNKKTGDLRTFANINYVVQSSARELLAHAWYRFATEFGHGDKVWFPVHDELILQVPEDRVDEVVADVERCMRFDFMGVPISASAVPLIDEDGRSRWMTSKLAEKYAKARAEANDLAHAA